MRLWDDWLLRRGVTNLILSLSMDEAARAFTRSHCMSPHGSTSLTMRGARGRGF